MPKLKHTEFTLGISLKSIELLNGSIDIPSVPNLSFDNFTFSIDIENKIDAGNKLLFSIVCVEIKNEDQKLILGSIKLSCIYRVDQFDELIRIDEEKRLNIPKELTEIVNSIAISTTRGVMFSTYKGTFLHNAFLPLIDPQALQLKGKKE